MKQIALISSLLLALMCSCSHPEQPMPAPEAPLRDSLATIDTLMQTYPDSALFTLLDFDKTHKDLTPFDRHYADLLISEALFKSDYEQTTRHALRQSLYYFDSLAAAYPKNDDCCLLSARSHYMNGVGLMEADSTLEACAEYLKALETVENHFDEKELVGYKAKFMALTCNRLGDLFSDQFMMESAIAFYHKSLVFGMVCPTSKYGISRTLLNIGQQFDMIGNADSAVYYFDQAFLYLPDTSNLYYRDIVLSKALINYFSNKDAKKTLHDLKAMREEVDDEDEKLTRAMTIGSIYFYEKEHDSAILYLKDVFDDTTDFLRRLQAASCLGKIYDSLGKKEEAETYMRFLAQQTMPEYENRILLSMLDDLYQQYLQWQHERNLSRERKQFFKLIPLVSIIVLILTLLIVIGKRKAARQKKDAETLISDREKEHGLEMQEIQEKHQATQNAVSALSGRLKRSNEKLRKQKEQTEILLKEKEIQQKRESWGNINDFIEEDICKEILGLIQGKNVKREAKTKDNTDLKLNQAQLLRLNAAAEKHFTGIGDMLLVQYPKMTKDEKSQCLLYLLDFDDKQTAALLGFDYSTIKKRSAKLKKAFGTEKDLPLFIKDIVL